MNAIKKLSGIERRFREIRTLQKLLEEGKLTVEEVPQLVQSGMDRDIFLLWNMLFGSWRKQ
jgi:hypothetical protein